MKLRKKNIEINGESITVRELTIDDVFNLMNIIADSGVDGMTRAAAIFKGDKPSVASILPIMLKGLMGPKRKDVYSFIAGITEMDIEKVQALPARVLSKIFIAILEDESIKDFFTDKILIEQLWQDLKASTREDKAE